MESLPTMSTVPCVPETTEPASSAVPEHESLPETVIAPTRGWQVINWAELWRFRELIAILAWRDIKVRYKQTVLGAAWAVLQPAMMMLVFTIFFGKLGGIQSGDLPYAVFVYTGLLPWMFVSTAITTAANSVLGSERLITKVYFPRLALPLSAVATALVDFCFAFGLLVVLMLWHGLALSWSLLLLPVFLLVLTVAALGVGILLAGLHVAYRDFRYVTPFLIQIGMFATPAIYMPADKFPTDNYWVQVLLGLNPLNTLIAGFRGACLGTEIPWGIVAGATALVAGVFLAGCFYFRRVEDWFADII
jgi:lipopolysaccharide transport system permease protein